MTLLHKIVIKLYNLELFVAMSRCGHCKRLKPEYAKAAEDLIRNDPPVYLAKVDCTEAGKETCNKHSVSGYPTLQIFRNGEFSQEYSGPREAAGKIFVISFTL